MYIRIVVPILATVLTGCRQGPPAPVDIEASDMCSLCRMAISQKQYAAEIIEAGGAVRKFDDIGCMLRFRAQRKPRVAAAYVIDFQRRNWIPAEGAFYIRSEKLVTPMGGGIIAADDRAAAERLGGRYAAAVLRFSELDGY